MFYIDYGKLCSQKFEIAEEADDLMENSIISDENPYMIRTRVLLYTGNTNADDVGEALFGIDLDSPEYEENFFSVIADIRLDVEPFGYDGRVTMLSFMLESPTELPAIKNMNINDPYRQKQLFDTLASGKYGERIHEFAGEWLN